MMDRVLVGGVRLLCGVYPHWVGCPPEPRQRIYFANHTSNLDTLVLWSAFPPALRAVTRPVAARDYWLRSALRRHLAQRVFHAILIERHKVTVHDNPIAQIIAEMGRDRSVILFPEGGRFPGPDPGPFKSGLYHLARQRPAVELVPVFIDNLNRVLPKGEVLPVPFLCGVWFGTPLHLEAGEPKAAFLERARAALMELRHV